VYFIVLTFIRTRELLCQGCSVPQCSATQGMLFTDQLHPCCSPAEELCISRLVLIVRILIITVQSMGSNQFTLRCGTVCPLASCIGISQEILRCRKSNKAPIFVRLRPVSKKPLLLGMHIGC
jgi:hypothetical protein